jgi:hypothetical protein
MPDATMLDVRRDLYRQFAVAPVAFSADGRDVRWAGPLGVGVEVGGIAVIEPDDGSRTVVQIREVHIVERQGPELTVQTGDGALGSYASSVEVTPMLRAVAGSAVILGRLNGSVFSPGDGVLPFGEQALRPATDAELAAVVATDWTPASQPSPLEFSGRRPRCRPGCVPRVLAGTPSCAGNPDQARPTPPACCSNGCWPAPACP